MKTIIGDAAIMAERSRDMAEFNTGKFADYAPGTRVVVCYVDKKPMYDGVVLETFMCPGVCRTIVVRKADGSTTKVDASRVRKLTTAGRRGKV